MKKTLAVLSAAALLLCAVTAGMMLTATAAGVSAIPDDVTKITPVCGDEGGATVELSGKSAVIHVVKGSHPDPDHADDPSYTVCNGAIFPLDGYAFTKADDLYCMVDISSDTAFRITIQDSLNNKWMNVGAEFWNSFDGVTAEQVTADYFIPAGTYQAAIYIEGYYSVREIPGDNRNIFQVEVDGLTPGTITLNNITFLPKADCQTDNNGVVVYTVPDGSAPGGGVAPPTESPTPTLPGGSVAPGGGVIPDGNYVFGDFRYGTFNDGTVGITGYTGSAEELAIPESIEGKTVSAIGDYAFQWCYTLHSVSLPESVTSIGENAFEGCTALTKVSIPGSVKSILGYAFSGCTALTEVTLAEGLTSIGFYAFAECRALPGIHLPESLITIESMAFYDCDSLPSIDIPDGVTEIGIDAFMSCDSLTSVTIPGGVDTIEQNAFMSCDNLTSVVLQDGVTTIEENAFAYCNNLASVTIPESVTRIAPNAFTKSSWADTELTIYGVPGSVAERYAKANGFAFATIGEENHALADVDTDGDGEVSTAEAQAFYTGFYDALASGDPPAGADVSGDGKVDIEDVLTVYLIASGAA